jgi:hypothetical protein
VEVVKTKMISAEQFEAYLDSITGREKEENKEYEREQKKKIEEIRRLMKGHESGRKTLMPSW